MMQYDSSLNFLTSRPKTWLVTGTPGFIGSNLLEHLLKLNQKVIGLDNFATGHQHNLDEVQSLVIPEQWARFTFIEGDIRSLDDCTKACCRARDPQALADVIIKLARERQYSPSAWQARKAAGSRRIDQKFSIEAMVEAYEACWFHAS